MIIFQETIETHVESGSPIPSWLLYSAVLFGSFWSLNFLAVLKYERDKAG